MSPSTLPLLNTIEYSVTTSATNSAEHARLSYARAMQVAKTFGLTANDILTLSDSFWKLHADPIIWRDGATGTLLTIHFNLCLGTILDFGRRRKDLTPLIDDLLAFRTNGQFCLTEVGHGLDAVNLETTATMLPSGDFVLHTPSPSAAKLMPPTVPAGLPTVAIVFARLVIDAHDRGIRPFVVSINDGHEMCTGVTAILLPYRGGSNPVNHAVTSFEKVHLPRNALLGSLKSSSNPRNDFLKTIWRVAVGSVALAGMAVSHLKISSTLGALYSQRRTVGDSTTGTMAPILQFRTQQIPILTAIAHAKVLEAYSAWTVAHFTNLGEDTRVRHGVAACYKLVSVQLSQAAASTISERCGAQGLFHHNMLTCMHAEMRGTAIAEGDLLGLSIRLAIELLLERYTLPTTTNQDSLLARHEASLCAEARAIMRSSKHHRSDAVNRFILPLCQPLVEAIGHRMAYDAAVAENIEPAIVELYLASVVKMDAAWYAENGLNRQAQRKMEDSAINAVLPHLSRYIEEMDVKPYITAPIVSDASWAAFLNGLPRFEGKGRLEAFPKDDASSLPEGPGEFGFYGGMLLSKL